jgi:hypothetical protein
MTHAHLLTGIKIALRRLIPTSLAMRILLLATILPLITGCTNKLYVPATYSPTDGDAVVGTIQDDQVQVYLENIEQTGKHMIFDLQVINQSDQPIVVDPHEIFYYGAFNPFPELTPGENVHSVFSHAVEGARGVYALTEEKVHKDIRATVRSQQAVGIVLAVAAAALVVNDIVQDSEDYSKEFWTKADANQARNRDIATFASLITVDMIRAGMEMDQMKKFEDLEYLPDEYLHEMILMPGNSVRGKVFLPVREVNHIRLVIPLGSHDYIFDFREATSKEMRVLR